MHEDFTEVGVVKALYRYPVKSMAGESLTEAHVYRYGLDGDRRFAFVRGDNRSDFPWLTARQVPELVQYTPVYTRPEDFRHSPVQVTTPGGRLLFLDSDELRTELAARYGRDVSLGRSHRGLFDTLALSLISTASLRALDESVDFHLDLRRFRQNILIETFSDEPFAEENWVDGVLVFDSGASIRLNERIGRCVMINVDPETAVKEPRVLKMVTENREQCAGMAGSTEKPGMIRVGDVIRLI